MKSKCTILLLVVVMSACSLHQVETPAEPAFVPDQFTVSGSPTLPDEWWTAFGDETLNELVAQTLEQNLNLQAAWSRLQQVEALAVQAGAPLQPQVNYNARASRATSIFLGNERTASNLGINLEAAYEVDLWKRLSARAKAGGLDAEAQRGDTEALATTLVASMARTWFGLLERRQQLALLEAQEEVNQQLLEIIELRFSNGSATAVDVYQQREQLANIQSQMPPVRQGRDLLEHQLAVLVGKPPKWAVPQDQRNIPVLGALPATGLPADLLERRPDVRAARLRIEAADHRLGAAIADRYPNLRLSASTGLGAERASDLFSNWIWSLAAAVAGPLLDGGRLKAEVNRNEAVLRERVASFEQSVLVALREVEDALASETHQGELLKRQTAQLELASAAYEAGRSRYLEGVGDFLNVLTSLQASQRTERALIATQLNLINNRIALYQSLGGQWTTHLDAPQHGAAE